MRVCSAAFVNLTHWLGRAYGQTGLTGHLAVPDAIDLGRLPRVDGGTRFMEAGRRNRLS